jgi:hypothetical protein
MIGRGASDWGVLETDERARGVRRERAAAGDGEHPAAGVNVGCDRCMTMLGPVIPGQLGL